MDDYFEDFNLKHESLAFYIEKHDEISVEFVEVISKYFNTESHRGEMQKWERKLGSIIIKIIKELRSILEMLEHIDIYKSEYKDIIDKQNDYCYDFEGLDENLKDKIRKCMTLKFLEFYQDRYEMLCKNVCGEIKNNVNVDEFLL